jgi:DNA-directed RNA polymerase specialized sigma24 family protein
MAMCNNNRADAEDLVQDALVRAWQRDPTNDNSNPVRWDPARMVWTQFCRLQMIAVLSDQAKKKATRDKHEALLIASLGDLRRRPVEETALAEVWVGYIVKKLSPLHRDVFEALYYGLTSWDVAEAMGVHPTLATKVRQRIRAIMESDT